MNGPIVMKTIMTMTTTMILMPMIMLPPFLTMKIFLKTMKTTPVLQVPRLLSQQVNTSKCLNKYK